MYIRINGKAFCESVFRFLILKRIDDSIPESKHDYPLNVFTCQPVSIEHAERIIAGFPPNNDRIECVAGPCPEQEERRRIEAVERRNEQLKR